MEYLSSDKIGIIDLGTAEIIEEELGEDLVKEKIGGAGITTELYKRFEDENPVVLGAGLLTGTLVPASALSVMTGKSPITGKICHIPLTLDAGMELKYSGFDYIVIKGISEKPVYLWIHDGIADVNDAGDIWGQDVWASTDYVRKVIGDDLVQVLGIGRAGEEESNLGQVCINYWSSADGAGLGCLFGRKNLKLIAIRGMGLLEIADPEEFVNISKGLLSEVKSGLGNRKTGLAEIAAALGEEDISEWINPLVHRHMACFNTPAPTNTFVFLDEDPSRVEEAQVEEPGFLLTDIHGVLGFKKLGLSAIDTCSILRDCAKYGINAVAFAELCDKSNIRDLEAIKSSFSALPGQIENATQSVFSAWAFLGNPGQEEWEKRQALAYIFGIHPIYSQLSPEISKEKLLELSNIGTELELDRETLDKVIVEIRG